MATTKYYLPNGTEINPALHVPGYNPNLPIENQPAVKAWIESNNIQTWNVGDTKTNTRGETITIRNRIAPTGSSGSAGGGSTGGGSSSSGGDTTGSSDSSGGATDEDGLTPEQKAAIKAGHDFVDQWLRDGKINNAEAIVLHEIFGGDYTSGSHIPTEEEINKIISDATAAAEEDLAPYYSEMTRREIEDLQNKMSDITAASRRYQQEEALNYKQKVASTKQNLRARGLTYSGQSRADLGATTFTSAENQAQRDVEGNLPMARRYDWENKTSLWEQQARDLGTEAERRLGSAGMPGLGTIIDPYSGSNINYNPSRTTPAYLPARDSSDPRYIATGDIALAKKSAKKQSIWDRVSRMTPYIS